MKTELKPLYANLRRLGISAYLMDNSFTSILIELDLDEEWENILDEFEINGLSVSEDYEKPFQSFLDSMAGRFTFTSTDDEENLIKVLLDFYNWSSTALEYENVYESLKKLDFDKEVLKRFLVQVKKINNNKTIRFSNGQSSRDLNKVFIIHGHDKVARLELEKLLKEFKLNPIVLMDTPGESLDTIISKFERAANGCASAIALFTPDDELKNNTFRPRQNVVLELGYFMGRDQQQERKIIILKRNPIDGPSDIHGVETFNFDKSVEEISMKIHKQLKHWKIVQ